jgi:hypothetical protein
MAAPDLIAGPGQPENIISRRLVDDEDENQSVPFPPAHPFEEGKYRGFDPAVFSPGEQTHQINRNREAASEPRKDVEKPHDIRS